MRYEKANFGSVFNWIKFLEKILMELIIEKKLCFFSALSKIILSCSFFSSSFFSLYFVLGSNEFYLTYLFNKQKFFRSV